MALLRQVSRNQPTLYDGGGTTNALQTDATGANVVASGADVIKVGGATCIEIFMMSETASDTGNLLVSEFRDEKTPTVANCSKVTEIDVGTDLGATVDRAIWGLTTATERKPKPVKYVQVTPGSLIMLNMQSVGTGPYYVVFTLHDKGMVYTKATS